MLQVVSALCGLHAFLGSNAGLSSPCVTASSPRHDYEPHSHSKESAYGQWHHGISPVSDQHPHDVSELDQLLIRRRCISKHVDCGQHGVCVIDTAGYPGCRCRREGKYVWGGRRCEVSGEVLPVRSEYLLGVSMGVIVALILAVVVVVSTSYLGCRKRRWNRDNSDIRTQTDGQRSYNLPGRVQPTLTLPRAFHLGQRGAYCNDNMADDPPPFTDTLSISSDTSIAPSTCKTTNSIQKAEPQDVASASCADEGSSEEPEPMSARSSVPSHRHHYRSFRTRGKLYREEEAWQDWSEFGWSESRLKSKGPELDRRSSDDRSPPGMLAIPRIPSSRGTRTSDIHEVRSLSSWACEDILSQLSDTYRNRPVSRTSGQRAGRIHPHQGPAASNLSAPERTYRVLLMGSLGPEPVFLYEPWREHPTATSDDDGTSPNAAAKCRVPYGHCRDPHILRNPDPPTRLPHGALATDVQSQGDCDAFVERDPDTNSDASSSRTIVAGSCWSEMSECEPGEDQSEETIDTFGDDEIEEINGGCACESDSDISVTSDEYQ